MILLLCSAAFLVRMLLDREPIDDAYITFRQAARLREGKGWGYNDGAPTIATTSPLWTLVLAPLSAHLPGSGRLLSILLDSVVPGLLFLISLEVGLGILGAIGVSMLYVLSPDAALCAPTGMELPLFQLLFCLSVLSLQRGWIDAATSCASLLPMTRPEGLLAAGLVSIAGPRSFRKPLRIAFLVGPFLCWTLFTLARHEGGPIPNSLAGKLAAYPPGSGSMLERLGEWVDYWGSLGFKTLHHDSIHNLPRALLYLGAVLLALLFSARARNPAWTLPAYGILYCLASLPVHIPLFSWYYCHPTLGICMGLIAGPLLALKSSSRLSRGTLKVAHIVLTGLVAVLLAGSLTAVAGWDDRENPPGWIGRVLIPHERERAHESLAVAIRKDLANHPERRHPKVLVHDLGVIGFLLPEAILVDVAGISTPHIADWVKRHPKEPPFRVSKALIESESPDYFVTLFEHGPSEEDWPWIEERYKRIGEFRGETWAVPWAAAFSKRSNSPEAPEH